MVTDAMVQSFSQKFYGHATIIPCNVDFLRESLAAALAAQPAAVGVVGSVRWGCLEDESRVCRVFHTKENAQRAVQVGARHGKSGEFYRVVAIVDPDAIVPLASAEPTMHSTETRGTTPMEIPLYPGIAQPAQERDG